MRRLQSSIVALVLCAAACDDPGGVGQVAAAQAASASAAPPDAASAAASAVPAASPLDLGAAITFGNDGKELRTVTLGELLQAIPEETFTAYDAYYKREKTFRALPLAEVVKKGFAGLDVALPALEFVLRAKDGFTVPLRGNKVFESGAYIAFADAGFPGWEPIGQQRANPGPFYLVWRGADQQDLETHPRPWQLATIAIARFDELFPHVAPAGEAAGSPAWRGFGIFKEQCIHCHAVNREGGRVGPELNVPQSIVEYRPIPQIKAYIRDPMTFRYGNMPAHPHISDADLDAVVAYFSAMKTRKHDPQRKPAEKKP